MRSPKMMENLKLFAKCGLAVLVVISIAILIECLTAAKYYWHPEPSEIAGRVIDDTALPTFQPIDPSLNQNFAKCLIAHTQAPYFQSSTEGVNSLQSEHFKHPVEEMKHELQNTSSACHLQPGLCMHYLLVKFTKLLKSFHVKLQMIEPSVLFCLLPSSRKYNLLTRGFSPKRVQGSRNVMTFGIFQTDAELLDKTSVRRKIISAGFRIVRYPKWLKYWQKHEDISEGSFETLHYFFNHQDMVIHLVVFYTRDTYLWHPGFNNTDLNLKHLLYVNDGAFENFTVSPLFLDSLATTEIFTPSDSRYFLLDMESSKFLECKVPLLQISTKNNSLLNEQPKYKQALATLKVLKAVLNAEMITFGLWSRTLLGWYDNCDILHYTSELEFSVTKKSVEGYNLSALFDISGCQTVENSDMSGNTKIELNCQEMLVHIFFMHEDNNTYWYEQNEDGKFYEIRFPVFTICSTAILGQKVNVPCETNKIFETEYGQNWRNLSLNFDPKYMVNAFFINKADNKLTVE